MAKGAESKVKITEKLLQVFEGAFTYNGGKEIRIPMTEDGQEVQIKIALTCAKTNVEPEGASNPFTVAPSEESSFPDPIKTNEIPASNIDNMKPTPEEEASLESILETCGLNIKY